MMQMQRSSSLPGPGHASPRTSCICDNMISYCSVILFHSRPGEKLLMRRIASRFPNNNPRLVQKPNTFSAGKEWVTTTTSTSVEKSTKTHHILQGPAK